MTFVALKGLLDSTTSENLYSTVIQLLEYFLDIVIQLRFVVLEAVIQRLE